MVVSIFFSIIPIQPQYNLNIYPIIPIYNPPVCQQDGLGHASILAADPNLDATMPKVLRFSAISRRLLKFSQGMLRHIRVLLVSLILSSCCPCLPPSPICRTCFANVHRTLPHSDCISMSIEILFGWECVFIEARWFSKRNLLITQKPGERLSQGEATASIYCLCSADSSHMDIGTHGANPQEPQQLR